MRLSGKVILITGAARGQGEAEARLFAAEGARVHLADVLDDEGERVAMSIRETGADAVYHRLDVSNEDDWRRVAGAIDTAGGRLDGLINNAGISFRKMLEQISLEEWERVHAINLTGPFLGMKHCAPLLRKSGGGSIVNVGSAAGMTGTANTAYCSSKWGLRGLSKSAAVLLADDRITVNAIHPGAVRTPMVADNPTAMAVLAQMTPLARMSEPDEIAELALFLVSDASAYITGTDIEIDGGMTNGIVYRRPAGDGK